MSNQYEVLGKAPDTKELQNLSSENNHLICCEMFLYHLKGKNIKTEDKDHHTTRN